MKTSTVQEASENLGRWLRRAMGGEQIAIHEGGCTVLLQPLTSLTTASSIGRLMPREALRLMQEESEVTHDQAAQYLNEVREERRAPPPPAPALQP